MKHYFSAQIDANRMHTNSCAGRNDILHIMQISLPNK